MSGNVKAIFDASAVLALLLDEPGAEQLRAAQADAAVSAVNEAETLAKLVGRGVPLAAARRALEALHLETIPFDSMATALSGRFVRKGVSLGDRCFLAAVKVAGAGRTSDRALGDTPGVTLRFFR